MRLISNGTSPKPRLVGFLRSAPWPHFSALASFSCALLLGGWAQSLDDEGLGLAAGTAWLGCLACLAGVGFCEADALARWREYLRLRSLLKRHGWRPLFLMPLRHSRCQRDAALLAAREAGYGERALSWFRAQGYRWHHVAPDRLREDPGRMFSPGFLRAAFLPRARRDERA
ncbi:hypothetical protein AAU61_08900 [Desulfocarbo indianensis]|nr:hypothetical protein AAU61_08900 [Desulfocarbo indianensis]